MDTLRVNALGAVGMSTLRPPSPIPKVQEVSVQGTATSPDLAQALAKDLFQRTFQSAVLFPVADQPTSRPLGFTDVLLGALTSPPAPATATPIQPTPSTLPVPVQAADLAAAQDALATSSSSEFAMLTALRFGAGVGALGAPALQLPGAGAGLVRDANAVARTLPLRSYAGGPGPEAFAHPQAPIQRALRIYQAPPAAEASVGLDLMA